MSPRKAKTERWLSAKRSDGYARRARQRGYRSRAVYKLEEMDQREQIVGRGMRVLELGAAPGGWSQYLADRVGNAGLVVAVDLLEMAPIRNVRCIRGDFTDPQLRAALIGAVGEADLVLSDSAPNITGVHEVDQARFKALLESTLDVARVVLKKGGSLLVKVFEGPEIKGFRVACEKEFGHVAVRKPAASAARSREFYVLARRFRGDRAPLYL